MNKTLIFIPTYNEINNIESILKQILALNLDVDILFLDDNSPDGTGQLLDALAKTNNCISIIHRKGKLGIGSAHIDGINWAYEKGYDKLITMDCDFTHSPDYIKEFIANADDNDIVIGSRFIQEESLISWNIYRRFLTNLGHLLTTTILSMPYDATGAYRLYRLDRISKDFLEMIDSIGYSFFFESLWILHLHQYRIKEIPTVLYARFSGDSKMNIKDALISLQQLITLFFKKKRMRKLIQSSKIK